MDKLQDYKSENGDVMVPYSYETLDGFKLGYWVSNKRAAKSKGTLRSDQIKDLDDLGFVWDVSQHQWQQGMDKLQDYKSENGDVMVPQDYETLDGFKLGIWVSNKRAAKSKGTLRSDQIKELDDSGFVWDVLSSSSANCGSGVSIEKSL